MSVLGGALLIAGKELKIELRTGEVVVTTGLFALLVVVMASLSFYIDPVQAGRLAPGVLWIAVTFAGVLAMGRSWARERENDAIRGLLLAPVPRSAIFLGKGVATFLLMLAIEALILPVVGILFHLDLLPVIGQVAALLFLGTLGFTAAGTLFASMSVRSRARDLVLSIVLFPLTSPALIAGVVGTREVLGGAPLADFLDFVRILTAFDLVFVVGGVVLFDTLMSD